MEKILLTGTLRSNSLLEVITIVFAESRFFVLQRGDF